MTAVTGSVTVGGTSYPVTASVTLPAPASTSANNGKLGGYTYAGITGSGPNNTFIYNNIWNPISGATQTTYAYNPGNWWVTANMPKGNTAVVSYPCVQQLYSSPALSSFKEIISTYSETMNATANTIGEAAWDIWLNNWANEVMIWVDNHGQNLATSGDTNKGTMTVNGQVFSIWQHSSEIIVALGVNQQSGSIDILTILRNLISKGLLPSTSTLTAIDFGWEVCSTGGVPETYQCNGYTITSG